MSEKPIIFSAEMVRAILAGHKTETRRVAASIRQSWSIIGGGRAWADLDFSSPKVFADKGPSPAGNPGPYLHVPWRNETMQRVYPRVQVGDHLWVRESFQPLYDDDATEAEVHDYETGAGYRVRYVATEGATDWWDTNSGEISDRVLPSIHMPKWAARLWLEVVEVRVERVMDITPEAALAEGTGHYEGAHWVYDGADTALAGFPDMWNHINAKRGFGWDENPWTWVIRFKRSEA